MNGCWWNVAARTIVRPGRTGTNSPHVLMRTPFLATSRPIALCVHVLDSWRCSLDGTVSLASAVFVMLPAANRGNRLRCCYCFNSNLVLLFM